jgi:hypothetical protein
MEGVGGVTVLDTGVDIWDLRLIILDIQFTFNHWIWELVNFDKDLMTHHLMSVYSATETTNFELTWG